MPQGLQWLQATRVTRIIQALQDVRNIPQQLRFLNRTRVVPAMDEEIMGRFLGRVLIADIITDDARAAVYEAGKFQLETTNAPNLKIGKHLPQAWLNRLLGLNGEIAADEGIFTNWLNSEIDRLLLGVRQRMESLIVAMHLDGFSYDRLGVKMSGVTWGMPSSLNVVAGTAWSNAGAATPVTDILTIQRNAQVRYDRQYRRLTMSTAAFNLMIATTEFQNKAKAFLPPQLTFTNLSLLSLGDMQELARSTLRVSEIELYDARYFYKNADGSTASSPFLPLGKIILSDPATDNDAGSTDFANGVVTESIVSALVGSGLMTMGRFERGEFGPVSYATAPPDLNPPNVTLWGVARGWPRKHDLAHNAVLDVGTVTDDISLQGDLF